MEKLIITAAICGAEVTKEQNPAVPYTVEEIVRDVLNKMHQYDNFSFRQIGMAIAVKRWAIYHNLSRYRSVYRFVRSVFKSKSHRF